MITSEDIPDPKPESDRPALLHTDFSDGLGIDSVRYHR